MKRPAGATIISGQSVHSLNESPALRARSWAAVSALTFASDKSLPSADPGSRYAARASAISAPTKRPSRPAGCAAPLLFPRARFFLAASVRLLRRLAPKSFVVDLLLAIGLFLLRLALPMLPAGVDQRLDLRPPVAVALRPSLVPPVEPSLAQLRSSLSKGCSTLSRAKFSASNNSSAPRESVAEFLLQPAVRPCR